MPAATPCFSGPLNAPWRVPQPPAGDVSLEEARWRGVEEVRGSGRSFAQAASAYQEGVRAKQQDIEGLLQVGGG